MRLAMEDWPRRHRITVDEYHRMAETGLLAPDARVELIEGEIVDMPPIGMTHAATVDWLARLFHEAVGRRAHIRCQGPIQLGDMSEPQPDLQLLASREDFYGSRRANEGDSLLAIEVSDSTLRYDLSTKRAMYARYGVPELWILDVQRMQLHVFRNPVGSEYLDASCTDQPGVMTFDALPGVEIDLSPVFA